MKITAFLAACFCASLAYADVPPPPKAESTVVVRVTDGTGSGFHIGHGVIVTAGHVVEGQASAKIEMSDGSTVNGRVILVDGRYDIAFVDTKLKGDQMEVASLACRGAAVGEEVMLRGNPVGLRFISAWGRVAGEVTELQPWLAVLPLNLTAGPGYSGGPVFDHDGKVIAVLVGGISSKGAVVLSFAVPSLSVCKARDYLGLK